jgi:hypothetical protein
VLSIAWGIIEKICVHNKDEEAFVTSSMWNLIDSFEHNEDYIFEECIKFLNIQRNISRYDAHIIVSNIFKKLHAKESKITKDDVLKNFFPYIDVPCFNWVGNLELIHGTHAMRDEYNEFQKIRQICVLKNGSCTLNMALTMMQLKHISPVFYLQNAGGIAGCRCYTNAAASNDMISLLSHDAIVDLKELIVNEKVSHQFHMFNSNHCVPELNPKKHNIYSNDLADFLFIDFTTAVYLFTKRNNILKTNKVFQIFKQQAFDNYTAAQRQADRTIVKRLQKYDKSKTSKRNKHITENPNTDSEDSEHSDDSERSEDDSIDEKYIVKPGPMKKRPRKQKRVDDFDKQKYVKPIENEPRRHEKTVKKVSDDDDSDSNDDSDFVTQKFAKPIRKEPRMRSKK